MLTKYIPLFEDENDREIIDTKHAVEQYVKRYSTIHSKEIVNDVIKKVMKVIIDKHDDKECEYGFHSRSTMIGGIISWTRYDDKNKDTGKNNAVIVTLFPPKRVHSFRDTCDNIFVENQIMFSLRHNRKFVERRKKRNLSGLCECYYFSDDKKSFVALFEGKFYDTSIEEYIVIE